MRVGGFDLLFQLFGLLLQLGGLLGLQAGSCGGFTETAGAQNQGGCEH
ncbi:hypothetical protein PSEUDO9AZ_40252 [Pseudomonas sp. 9AZ]|nr:hypothetical protein PSEUDO9AZ_40252 [Pseudomonas sp. 9AZ]